MWGFIPSQLSYTLESMKCDFEASLLACTFTNPYFGYEPKARVVTPAINKNIFFFAMWLFDHDNYEFCSLL
jgi:hypothetical protein